MEHTIMGERLHIVRRRQNLSQADLAEKAGVTVTTISGIESRGVDVHASTLTVLAQALEVSADYLLGICEEPESYRTPRTPPTRAHHDPSPRQTRGITHIGTPEAPPESPRLRGPHKLTPLQINALQTKRACGVPIKTLMQEYGVSKATVCRYLAQAPPAVRPAAPVPARRASRKAQRV